MHGGFYEPEAMIRSYDFDEQLAEICMSKLDDAEMLEALKKWKTFKWAEYLHPREDHLIPLFVCMGLCEGKKK